MAQAEISCTAAASKTTQGDAEGFGSAEERGVLSTRSAAQVRQLLIGAVQRKVKIQHVLSYCTGHAELAYLRNLVSVITAQGWSCEVF